MYLGEQLINPDDRRLTLSAQLGVRGIVIDSRPNKDIIGDNGAWDAAKVAKQRKWIESFGLTHEVLALDTGSILYDSLHNREKADAAMKVLQGNVRAAAEGGVPTVKFNLQIVGITRTAFVKGRGGVECTAFKAADYSPEKDKQFSYWGVVVPGADAAPDDPERCGQISADEAGGIAAEDEWRAIEYLIENLLPVAEQAGVRLAGHPHDPAYPPEGLNGVHHVLGSMAGLRRYIDIAPGSKYHGLNFCQGTIAEMSPDPTAVVLEAIREFGSREKIFMVHFRNILGGYLDFREAFPDEGSVDMAACLRAYNDVGYRGPLCPDHVPLSGVDPDRERFFSFALGYTRGLLDALGIK